MMTLVSHHRSAVISQPLPEIISDPRQGIGSAATKVSCSGFNRSCEVNLAVADKVLVATLFLAYDRSSFSSSFFPKAQAIALEHRTMAHTRCETKSVC